MFKGIRNEILSFFYAFSGILLLILRERHARFHLVAALLVIFAGFYFEISRQEWLWIIACIAGVLAAEGFNTAVEKLADITQPEQDPRVKYLKDVAAGAVLIVSIAAAIIGLIIFVPHL